MKRERSPWKTLSKREIYRNRWIHLHEHRVIQPDGIPSIYGVIHARPYVGIVPYEAAAEGEPRLSGGYVHLVHQWRYPLGRNMWAIPTGMMEKGESFRTAARRELAEEVGVAARRWTSLGSLQEANGVSTIEGTFFAAQELSPVVSRRDGAEADLIVERVSWREAMAWVERGRISDAISVASLLKWDRMLRRGKLGKVGKRGQ